MILLTPKDPAISKLRRALNSIVYADPRLASHWLKLKAMRLLMPTAFSDLLDGFCRHAPIQMTVLPIPGTDGSIHEVTAAELLSTIQATPKQTRAIHDVVLSVWLVHADEFAGRGQSNFARSLNHFRAWLASPWVNPLLPKARIVRAR
jgi:hypothetical protein